MNSKHGFDPKHLYELAQEQIKLETKSIITIKSIHKFGEPTEEVLKSVSARPICPISV